MEILVETRRGRVRGQAEAGLAVFRGLPYARAPVGPLRFAPPEPAPAWTRTRDATRFAPSASQNGALIGPVMSLGIGRTAEDCLYLNVWTPAADRRRRPVMVWIHGGAFVLGSGSQMLYDGATLARRGDVVVVTINYRLGAFGFLRLCERFGPRLPATGNEGLLDQIAALEWVRDEIEAFGGDPGQVTIFGESAGAMSCATLLAMPRARGLFHRAILQSGGANFVWPREIATRLADHVVGELGVSSPEALQGLAADRILEVQRRFFGDLLLGEDHVLGGLSPAGQRVAGAMFLGLTLAQRRFGRVAVPIARGLADLLRQRGRRRASGAPSSLAPLRPLRTQGLPFQPVIDGDQLPLDPLAAVGAGAAREVPLLIGTNRDESQLFAPLDPEAASLDEARLVSRCEEAVAAGRPTLRGMGRQAVDAYRAARAARGERVDPAEIWFAVETDRTMRYPAMSLATAHAAHQPRTYAYLFTWPSPVLGGMLGSCHALDLPFVFGTLEHRLLRPVVGRGPEALTLAARIQDAWVAFARTGTPGHPGLGDWPAYDRAQRRTMVLDGQCRVESAPREPERAFWETVERAAGRSPA
jgi:para-nitrobenzyl esterase